MDETTSLFLENVSIPADVLTDCWVWTGSTNGRGYGTFKVGPRVLHAHRIAYELVHGSIAQGFHVRHACDWPSCVSPRPPNTTAARPLGSVHTSLRGGVMQ